MGRSAAAPTPSSSIPSATEYASATPISGPRSSATTPSTATSASSGGKTLRDGLGAGVTATEGALDFVITNALVVDAARSIVKADIGIKDGRIGASATTAAA